MKTRFLILSLLLPCIFLGAQPSPAPTSLPAPTTPGVGEVPVISFDELQTILRLHPKTILLVNFWATWCDPCVSNLPTLAKLAKAYEGRGVKVLLVSFDDPEDAPAVRAALKKAGFASGSFILQPGDRAKCVQTLSADWQDIVVPANFVFDGSGKVVHEYLRREHTMAEWEKVLGKSIN